MRRWAFCTGAGGSRGKEAGGAEVTLGFRCRCRLAQGGFCLAGVAVFSLSLLEAAGLTSIVHQNRESAALDRDITEQIVAIYPDAKEGEIVFVSLCFPPLAESGIWRQAPTSYESGRGYAWLWDAYGMRVNSLTYQWARRWKAGMAQPEMGAVIEEWSREGVPKELVPFYLDPQWKVHALGSIQVRDESDTILIQIDFPKHAGTLPEDRIALKYVKTDKGYFD